MNLEEFQEKIKKNITEISKRDTSLEDKLDEMSFATCLVLDELLDYPLGLQKCMLLYSEYEKV
jgi:hypothetical protein